MSNIKISNISTAGNDLFQGSESFLTELETDVAREIIGGHGRGHGRGRGRGRGGYGGGCGCGGGYGFGFPIFVSGGKGGSSSS